MSNQVLKAYAQLWAATTVGFALSSLLELNLVQVGTPHDALPATTKTAATLLAHNLPVALWPIALVGLGWSDLRGARGVANAMVLGQQLMHGLIVGSAIGQRPELWRYLPHLPFEWLGIALPVAGWRLAGDGATDGVPLLALAAGASVCVAAALETWAVPL